MGKIPPSLRSLISTALIRKPPTSLPPTEYQSPFPPLPRKPHHVPKRPTKKKLPGKSQVSDTLFKTPDLGDAKKLFNLIVTTRGPTDVKFHNSILQSYAAISTIDDSVSLLRHMVRTNPSFSPDRSTYHILLSQSSKEPNSSLSSVHRILNLMVNAGLGPDQVTTDIAVRSLCEVDQVDEAVDLIKELSVKHSRPDTYTYNFLVKKLCKCRALSTVYGFVDEMRSSFDIKPDLVTYTILIDNVCNTKNLREATRLVGMLSDSGIKPDCFMYNTIMKGYCMLNRGSEAIGVYKKMEEEGVKPDLVTYNTLIFGLSKSGRVKDARKYLNIMVESGHFPDVVTYTSLMNGMCREGDAFGALSLLEEMEAKGCSPNSCTYNTLLQGLCKSRLLEKGVELYELMKSADMKLDMASYATFVRALCRDGRVAEAYEVFDYAAQSKSLTDVAAYSTLETTLKWLKKARVQGLAM